MRKHEAREFWICETISGVDEGHIEASTYPYTLIGSTEEVIHVIEYAAYDKLAQEKAALEAEVERLKNLVTTLNGRRGEAAGEIRALRKSHDELMGVGIRWGV